MSILKRPYITEKSQALNEKNKYTFEVDRSANKISIAKAIEDMYNVTVEDVKTITQFGKKRSKISKGRVVSGYTNTFKKAIITVKDGDIIDFYGDI